MISTKPPHASEPSTPAEPQVSAVIVSWNARDYLEKCLRSLESVPREWLEVIVVDNASRDGSPDMLAQQFPWVRLVRSAENHGFARANNIAIGLSRGKYIGLVNSDVEVFPGCLERLAEFLDANPRVGMVGPRVLYGDRRLQSSCRHFPTVWNNTCEALGLNKLFPRTRFFTGEHMFYFDYCSQREVDVLVGCFILARRAAVDEFGLLDETFWMYGEDVDWSRRCWQAGWKVVFYPEAEAIHYCGGSSSNDPIRFEVAQQHARLQLWAKHHNRAERKCLVLLIALQRLIRTMATLPPLLSKRKRACAKARAQLQVAGLKALLQEAFSR